MKRIVLLVFCVISYQWAAAQSSVLAGGNWFKVGITETGVYKIDRTTLDILGISQSVNPSKIKVYGNGVQGILPQQNSEERPEDLVENAIYVRGESDGTFGQNDYILFYGVGPDQNQWTNEGFSYEKNIYSDTAYYFIRVGGANGKRIESKSSLTEDASLAVTSFNDHIVFEEEETNLISSGRGWYGDRFNSGEGQTYSHQINGLNSGIDLVLSAVSESSEGGIFEISNGSDSVGSIELEEVPDGPGTTYSIKAFQEVDTFSLPNTNDFDFRINFDGGQSGERGYLDYYALLFTRNLRKYNNDETHFRVLESVGQVTQYEIGNASSATIWNVTDPANVEEQSFSTDGAKAIFKSQDSALEEFVVFEGSDFPTPFIFGSVNNQNLRGSIQFDGLIVTHPLFLAQAQELAQFHQTHDGLSVKVSTTTEVYNEFSSGRQDITAIRDYARYMYENGGSLKYLLLFGDCSFDYKDRLSNNTNFVPTYESRQSFHPIFSYSSDDYYGFFEEDEGEWIETSAGDHTLEIGVGRLPVSTTEEAQDVVDKIIYYSTSSNTLGKWRNEITYVGDDGDGNVHARHVEELSELIDTTYAQYEIRKVLLDAFTQDASGSSETSPQTNAAIKTRLKNGTFTVNYVGHGNERLWTAEEILTRSDIEELTNRNKLPIIVTATCEFGRYDDPFEVSGAEALLLSTSGGGIALLTTSRPVFASTNFSLNLAFHQNIFRKENNRNLRLGDIIRLTKNEGLEGAVNRNFTLLGDPMMMPAFPEYDIEIDDTNSQLDTLSALEEITITGQVEENGTLKTDFNGQLVIGIYDVEQDFITKGQQSAPYTYELRSNSIFRGEATVTDGEFSVTFIVPKNISYQFQRGKLSVYAWDQTRNQDAGGSSRSFVIGGTSENAPDDDTPPEIQLYMNDDSFRNGDVVGDSPLLIAQLADESGITTTRSGVVQGISLTFEDEIINLNDFYTAGRDSYQNGTVIYPLQDLEPGRYSATIEVWDTHNNSSESSIEFVVTDEARLFVYNPLAYPNPVRGATTFAFEHDREDEDLEVTLMVYGSGGEVVSQRTLTFENSVRSIEIPWEAQTVNGQPLVNGIYYARMIIRSTLDGAAKEINQKLVIVDY